MTSPNPKYGVFTLAEVERTEIEHALEACPNIDTAARCLGISRSTLLRKRREYGLSVGKRVQREAPEVMERFRGML